MRLDLYLKKTCIVRHRADAKEICAAGAVCVNGQVAKPGHDVRPGDRVQLRLARRELELRVLDVPSGNVDRRDAARYVEIVADTWLDPGRDTEPQD